MVSLPTITHRGELEGARAHGLLKRCSSFPVLLAVLLVGAVFVVVRSLRLDPDTWWHIKMGQDILATGHWPTADTYSFTVYGKPWIDYEWGGDVALALAMRFGLPGLEALLIVLTGAIMLLTYYYAHLRSGNPKAAFVACAIVLPLANDCFSIRPQLIGYIFLLTTLICLERFRQGTQKTLWVLPPLFLIWVNTHSSFPLGLVALGLYWASGLMGFWWGGLRAERWPAAERKHLELVGLLSLVALMPTPYGARLAAFPAKVAFSLPVNVARIQEWQPANFSFGETKLVLLLVFAFVLAQVTLRPSHRLEEVGLFLFAAYSTFVHYRFVILFALIFAPLLAALVARWTPAYEPRIDHHVVNAVLILAVGVGMVKYFPSQADLSAKVAKDYPVEAVRYLERNPVPGPMFNAYGFGGYMVWSLGPAHKVFIDGRGDLYEYTGVFSDYLRIMDVEPDTLALLNRYGIQSCLIHRDLPLATLLRARPEWKQVYADDVSVLFARDLTPRALAMSGISDVKR